MAVYYLSMWAGGKKEGLFKMIRNLGENCHLCDIFNGIFGKIWPFGGHFGFLGRVYPPMCLQ